MLIKGNVKIVANETQDITTHVCDEFVRKVMKCDKKILNKKIYKILGNI